MQSKLRQWVEAGNLISPRFPAALLVTIGITLATGTANAQATADRLRLTKGSEAGEVIDMSPTEVTVKKTPAGERKIAVNTIKTLTFHGEPLELTQARVNAGNGGFSKALELLDKINVAAIKRDYVKQDVEYYKALCAARLALGGTGEIGKAGQQLSSFARGNPKSFHFLEAAEVIGDLLMAGERYPQAEKTYGELAKAPWPEYKIRSAVAVGRSLQAQNKPADAIKQFDAALAVVDDTPESQKQKLAATLGKAVSLAESGKGDEAVTTIEKIIQDADPSDKELQARAHNALGTCYEKAGRKKDALFSFLYVDVIYNTIPEAHAEALSHLTALWKAVGQDERSREARQMLLDKYAGSRWAKETP